MDIRHYYSLTLITLGLIIYFILKFKFGKNPLNSKNRFYKEKFNYNSDDIIRDIQLSLDKSGFFNIYIDKENSTILAESKVTMESFGEIIYIEINQLSNNQGTIKFESVCKYPLQIFDWGKNKKNFQTFYNLIEKTNFS